MKNGKPWTREEKEMLVKYFPLEGKHCEDRFPRRTRAAIVSKANKMGLKYTPKDICDTENDDSTISKNKYYTDVFNQYMFSISSYMFKTDTNETSKSIYDTIESLANMIS